MSIKTTHSTKSDTSTALIIGVGGLALLANVFLTGCSAMAGEGWGAGDHGRILISADAEGMNAFSDMLQGSIVNGKASPDTESSHYQLRKEQTRVKAMRYSSFSAQPRPKSSGLVRGQDVQLGAEYK